jgi:predicted nucleic acid-binding protein
MHGRGRAGSAEVAGSPWIAVRSLLDSSSLQPAAAAFSIGLGEMSTILLGKELNSDVLLIDEWKARRVAAAFGVAVVGCAGLLERLYLRGHIADLRSAFRELADLSYIDVQLLNARLDALGLETL